MVAARSRRQDLVANERCGVGRIARDGWLAAAGQICPEPLGRARTRPRGYRGPHRSRYMETLEITMPCAPLLVMTFPLIVTL